MGPAAAIMAAPNSSYFTLSGLNGTGFAAKMGAPKAISVMAGSNTVINGSTCFNGFRLTRPCSAAVSSPSFKPTKACIAS